MKNRISASLFSLVAMALVVGTFLLPEPAMAQEQEQEQADVQTMWVVARGEVLVLRLYDEPDPLGKTQKTVPAGSELKVHTDQVYNKYWYKTTEGFYAHSYYLTNVDPSYDPEAQRAQMSDEERQREGELMDKYNNLSIVSDILSQRIQIGFTMEQTMESWGNPDDQRISPTTMGDNYVWTYYNPPGGIKRTVIKFDHRKKIISMQTDK